MAVRASRATARGGNVIAFALAVTSAGCNQILGVGDLRGGIDAHVDVPDAGPITVSGRLIARYYDVEGIAHPSGTTTFWGGGDLSLVYRTPGADDTTFTTVPLTVGADGRFTVPGVPGDAPYDLRVGLTGLLIYVESSGPSLEIISPMLGRPDAVDAAPGDAFVVDATGMSPWGNTDEVRLYSAGTGGTGYPSQNLPAVGATTLAGTRFAWGGNKRVDRTKGDFVAMFHSAPVASTAGVMAMTAVDRAVLDVDQQTGDTAVTTHFNPTTRTFDYAPTLATADFLDPVRAAYGVQDLGAIGWDVAVAWSPTAADLVNGNPTQLFVQGTGEPPALGTFAIDGGNQNQRLVRTADITYQRQLTIPGTSTIVTINGYCGASNGVSVASDPIRPLVGPPTQARLNDAPPFTNVLAPFSSPPRVEVSWSPPTVGTADQYIVTVERYAAGQSSFRPVALLETRRTSVVLPPEIFENGQAYAVRVAAESNALAHDGVPLGSGLPYSYVEVIAGAIAFQN